MANKFWKILGIGGGLAAAGLGLYSLVKGNKAEDEVEEDQYDEEDQNRAEADEDSEEE